MFKPRSPHPYSLPVRPSKSLSRLALLVAVTCPGWAFAGPPDGLPDIIFGTPAATICQGDGAGGTDCVDLADTNGRIDSVSAADLNGDGADDLLLAHGAHTNSQVCLSDGIGNLDCRDIRDGDLFTDGDIGDVNGDGLPDLILAQRSSDFDVYCLNDGSGTFADSDCTDFATAITNGANAVKAGDLNNDGHLDVIFAHRFNPSQVCLGDGTGAFTCSVMTGSTNNGFGLEMGDLDDDGDLDALIVGNTQICLNDGAGTLSCVEVFADFSNSAGIGDFDEDGQTDLVIGRTTGISMCLGDGTATEAGYSCTEDTSNPMNNHEMAVGDINLDGHADVAIFAGNNAQHQVCLGDGAGALTCTSTGVAGASGGPSGVAIADVTGPDLPTLSVAEEIPGAELETVDVTVVLSAADLSLGATSFSVDYDESCLQFDDTDANADNIPDSVVFHSAADFAVTAFHDGGDSDGELDISITDLAPPIANLRDGDLVTLTFTSTCEPDLGTTTLAPVHFSADPAASFSTDLAVDVAGLTAAGSVEIWPGPRGDCNGTGFLSAADLIADALEIFDNDGTFWADVPGSTFVGSPVGCDANDDTVVNAGDISCTILRIFGGDCAASLARGGQAFDRQPATIAIGRARRGERGMVWIPIQLKANPVAASSTAFSLDLPAGAVFDAFDGDGDGVPNGIRVAGRAADWVEVRYNANDRDGELDLVIADFDSALRTGTLVEVGIRMSGHGLKAGVQFASDPGVSFGDLAGRSVAGKVSGTDGAGGMR